MLLKNRMVIMIVYWLFIIWEVDKIIVLDYGSIIEMGNYGELM